MSYAFKHITECCALSQITCNNRTHKTQINEILRNAKRELENGYWLGRPKGFGERSFFVIVCPGEEKLEQKLIDLKFKHVHTFGRRAGYPEGLNKMYIINID